MRPRREPYSHRPLGVDGGIAKAFSESNFAPALTPGVFVPATLVGRPTENLAPLNRIVIAMPERQIIPFIALGFCSNYGLLGFLLTTSPAPS